MLYVVTSLLIATTLAYQQRRERTWWDASQVLMRWTVYTTILVPFAVSGLAVLQSNLTKYWPVLDALTWLSGLPLGMVENGRLFSADSITSHLVLLNRWMMGAVASAVGSLGFLQSVHVVQQYYLIISTMWFHLAYISVVYDSTISLWWLPRFIENNPIPQDCISFRSDFARHLSLSSDRQSFEMR